MRPITLSFVFLALGSLFARQQVVDVIEKNPGKPQVAVPDFSATGTTAPSLMAIFNSTVQHDLQNSPALNFVPKTLYPLHIPQTPADLATGGQANANVTPMQGYRLEDWLAAPTKAHYVGLGYAKEDRSMFVVSGWLYATRGGTRQQAQMFGKVYSGALDEAGAVDAAHRFAADILGQLNGRVGVGAVSHPGDYRGYAQLVHSQLLQNWNTNGLDASTQVYPAVVRFHIFRDGTVRDLTISQPSGNPKIDNSALRAVYSASPLPALPPQITEDDILAQFSFDLR